MSASGFFSKERSITQPAKAKQATIPIIAVIPSILTSHHFRLMNLSVRIHDLNLYRRLPTIRMIGISRLPISIDAYGNEWVAIKHIQSHPLKPVR
jgi:hypothetical protein